MNEQLVNIVNNNIKPSLLLNSLYEFIVEYSLYAD